MCTGAVVCLEPILLPKASDIRVIASESRQMKVSWWTFRQMKFN